jgi:hypothetical protein
MFDPQGRLRCINPLNGERDKEIFDKTKSQSFLCHGREAFFWVVVESHCP